MNQSERRGWHEDFDYPERQPTTAIGQWLHTGPNTMDPAKRRRAHVLVSWHMHRRQGGSLTRGWAIEHLDGRATLFDDWLKLYFHQAVVATAVYGRDGVSRGP